jgi:hypothetical protein
LFYKIEECVGKTSIGYALEFAAQNLYDVIVGSPSCINGNEWSGSISPLSSSRGIAEIVSGTSVSNRSRGHAPNEKFLRKMAFSAKIR